ncbi:MAG: FAD-dependent oxidoreductase [Clostridia bacterium]|nr:FAD-dependent oxidoreductase [Clostridia bacterium]MBQ7907789.1 FAD-dependent oxidoreductase [Clostridia bacterium]
MFDIIVIGGGPAGLTAALYARRANKTVLVIEKEAFGGQITHSPKVENIPGFIELSGNEFADKLLTQAMEQGAEIEVAEVTEIIDGATKVVVTDSGSFESKSVIIATGAKHRLLGLEREVDFIGQGISFCAVCDGAFYEGKTVAVIGGGNSALQEALMLSELCKKVYVVQNLDTLTGEKKLQELIYKRENIEVICGSLVKELKGENELSSIVIENNQGKSELIIDGMFVAIGLVPQNEFARNIIPLNKYGYALADETCSVDVQGIYVAGDCRQKRIRQVVTAAADGATAALAACDYIDSLK